MVVITATIASKNRKSSEAQDSAQAHHLILRLQVLLGAAWIVED
jgi:hypothetical protein